MKVNLGAGSDIRPGWINHDLVKLQGIDVTHDLNIMPWPWPDSSLDEIHAMDVLEHLEDFMLAMAEIWRVLKPRGILLLSVPYMNSVSAVGDPTHRRSFHETTFYFFDPTKSQCRNRFYYTHVRFLIEQEEFVIAPFHPYFIIPGLSMRRVRRRWSRLIVGLIGNYFITNLILDLHMRMQKISPVLEESR